MAHIVFSSQQPRLFTVRCQGRMPLHKFTVQRCLPLDNLQYLFQYVIIPIQQNEQPLKKYQTQSNNQYNYSRQYMNKLSSEEYVDDYAVFPQKQLLEGTMGCLKYTDEISRYAGYCSCFLLNKRTIIAPFQFVFNKQTQSYNSNMYFFINQLQSYQVIEVSPLTNKTKNKIEVRQDTDYVLLKLDRNVESRTTLFSLKDQHHQVSKDGTKFSSQLLMQQQSSAMNNQDDKDVLTKQLNDMRQQLNDMKQKLIEISHNLQSNADYYIQQSQQAHVAARYCYYQALDIQQYVFGQYSLETIKLRNQMSDAFQIIQRDESMALQQYRIIANIYQKQGMLNDQNYGEKLYQLAHLNKQCYNYVEAISFYQQALNFYAGKCQKTGDHCAEQLIYLYQKFPSIETAKTIEKSIAFD